MDDLRIEGPDEPAEAGDYCRAVERHLCQRNHGHLVRVVGPSFDVVCGWFGQGVPIRVALQGIDRSVERHERKGPRRRPVRVEHCDADVQDAFDEWRRAVGVSRADASLDDEAGAVRRASLSAHLDRTQARLALVASREADLGPRLRQAASDAAVIVGELARTGKRARGALRADIVDRLRALDESIMRAAHHDAPAELLADLARQASAELAAYRDRMPEDAFARARESLIDRLLRDRYQLPIVRVDA